MPDGVQMGEILGFVSKSERERLRLIREARAIYESIFPACHATGEQPDRPTGQRDGTKPEARCHKSTPLMTSRS